MKKIARTGILAVATFLALTGLIFLGMTPYNNIVAQGALVGTVCIVSTTATGCPSTVAIITGPTTGTVQVSIFISGSDSLGGAKISVVTDPTILNPISISFTRTVVPSPQIALVDCINGVPVPGSGGSCQTGIDGLGVASLGILALGATTIAPTTGNLFNVTYNILGSTTGTPIAFLVNSLCANQSVTGTNDCILITAGAAVVPETALTATFINLPTFRLSASPAVLGITVGQTGMSTITVNGFAGFTGTVNLTPTVNSTATNHPIPTLNPTSVTLPGTTTSTLSFPTTTPDQAGGYNVTVAGTSGAQIFSASVIIKVTATTTISTKLSSNSIIVGTPIIDTATLSGASAKAGGTVSYNLFSTSGCTGTSRAISIVTVLAGVVPASQSVPINSTGTLSLNATYSGDFYNTPSTSSCEPFTVTKASPIISTLLSSTTIVVGSTAIDTATISGGFFGPAVGTPFSSIVGNVTYNLFAGSACAGTSKIVSFVPVNGNTGSVPASRSVLFNSTSTWSWNATYTGDSNNNKALSACEPLTVQPASPIITTTLSATNIGVGGSASDTAALTGGYNPTGTIIYYLFVGGTGSCTGTSHIVTTVTVSNNGLQTSSRSVTFNNTITETFGWNATYSGDSNNNKAVSICELLTVTATPDFSISSTQSALTIQLGTTGTFTVTVTSINLFSGSVTITNSTTPSTGLQLACSPNPVPVTPSTPGISTCTFTANSAGTYSVTIIGTSITPSATHSIVPVITVTVPKATPSLTTVVNTPTIILSSGPQSTTDTAMLSGGFNPTGTIVFKIFGPNDNTCAGSTVTLSSSTVNGNSAYTSSAFTPSAGAGTYEFAVSYSGDGNNALFTATCGTETLTVSKAAPVISTQIFNATSNTPVVLTDGVAIVVLQTSVYDTASFTGAFSVTGSITYTLYSGNTCTSSLTTFIVTIDANHNVPNLTSTMLPAFIAGNYSITAAYAGDGNNLPAVSGCEVLTVNALPVAVFTATPQASLYVPGTSLSFNPSSSHDPDATVLADKIAVYTWYFGEGTPMVLSTSATVSHTYNAPGTYVVTLTVTDLYGGTNTTSLTVTIGQPQVTIVSAKLSTTSPTIGDTVTLTVDIRNGGVPLSFNVTMTVNAQTVDQQQVTLQANQENSAIVLHWNTAGFQANTYTITIRLVNSRLNGPSGTPVSLATSSLGAGSVALQAPNTSTLPGGNTLWIVIGVIAAIVVIAGVVIVLRRRKTVSA